MQVDATAPSLEITCPATAVQGESVQRHRDSLRRPVGPRQRPERERADQHRDDRPVQTMTRTADDNVGHKTTTSCTTEVVYPTPGAPTMTSGGNPNNGHFTLGWRARTRLSNIGLTLHAAAAPDLERDLDDRGQRHRSAELRIPEIGQGGGRHVALPRPGRGLGEPQTDRILARIGGGRRRAAARTGALRVSAHRSQVQRQDSSAPARSRRAAARP